MSRPHSTTPPVNTLGLKWCISCCSDYSWPQKLRRIHLVSHSSSGHRPVTGSPSRFWLIPKLSKDQWMTFNSCKRNLNHTRSSTITFLQESCKIVQDLDPIFRSRLMKRVKNSSSGGGYWQKSHSRASYINRRKSSWVEHGLFEGRKKHINWPG